VSYSPSSLEAAHRLLEELDDVPSRAVAELLSPAPGLRYSSFTIRRQEAPT
jgi:hypothetical protein